MIVKENGLWGDPVPLTHGIRERLEESIQMRLYTGPRGLNEFQRAMRSALENMTRPSLTGIEPLPIITGTGGDDPSIRPLYNIGVDPISEVPEIVTTQYMTEEQLINYLDTL